MSAIVEFRQILSMPLADRVARLWAGVALGLVLVSQPVSAGDGSEECRLDNKAKPAALGAVCTAVIDRSSTSETDRSAALVARADARARISGGLTEALKDLDRAIALDGKNALAYRTRGDLLREAGGDLGRAAADLSTADRKSVV